MRRMCAACCKAKECLSASSYTNILIENLHNDTDYKTSVRKAKFEELNMDLFNQSIKLIDETLKDANVSQEDIHVVVMAGGSTKIPKLSEILTKKFQEQVLPGTIDPEDIVSYGCVMESNILAGHPQSEQLTELLLLDVEPLSLGLETAENVMMVMVPRNATIPCKKTLAFTTYHDDQVTMVFRLFEGERCFSVDNNDLGMFEMTGIWPEPRGRARIDVTFEIDSNGVLTVTAVNRFSRKSQSCSFTDFKSFYDYNELEDIIESATSSKEIDEKNLSTVTSKLELVSFITNIEAAVEDGKDIHGDVKQTVLNKCGEVKDWIASQESIEQNMFEEKLSLLQSDVSSLVNLNSDVINHCRNEKLHFISGRVQNKAPRKSKGLSKGWGKGRGDTSSTLGNKSTRPAPAVDFTIDEVD
ncbi:heat shock cognate 71 kDa protein-like isoform X1 [Argopecten irradians]|uniref:heat shock cognate 71 kDa protein-like isoform X1 n=1 Tax=Argopecten irradians TaxID=31199 RepID=UPI00371B5E97